MNGTDLKVERVRRGVKQYRLAAALGIPPTTLSKIENGQRRLPPSELAAIARTIRDLAGSPTPDVNDGRAA